MRQSRSLSLCGAIALICLAGCNDRAAEETTVGEVIDDTTALEPEAATATAPGAGPAPAVEGRGPAGQGAGTTPGAVPGSNPIIVATAGAAGPYLANSAGSALYFVEGDTDGSKCTGPCTEVWPPFLVGEVAPAASAPLQAGMLGTITRADGDVQVSYNQHPLYRYAADAGAGRTAGNDVEDQWGHWHLVGPDGEPVAPEAAPAGESQ